MSSGKPDWYTSAVLTGKYGINFLPVAVDGEGNIRAVLQGTSIISGNVNATDLDTIKQIQGIEGATYRTIAVDSLGQLIAVMKSAAGNNVVVDASGFLSAILKGTYAAAGDKNIAVDADGRLMAMLKALYGSTVKDVQSDINGNLNLNLKAQDLAEIINRPKYGGMKIISGGGTIGPRALETLLIVAGKGMTYAGFLYFDGSDQGSDIVPILTIDNNSTTEYEIQLLRSHGLTQENLNPIYLTLYNVIEEIFTVGIKSNLTFETQAKISVRNISIIRTISYEFSFCYALI